MLRGEFIGLYVTTGEIKGRIRDETKNLFMIETKDGMKKVNKKNNLFIFRKDDKEISLDGNKLLLRPEDRIKARW